MKGDAAAAQRIFDNALLHHQAGRLAEAEQLYLQIPAADPRHADGLHLLGVIAIQRGRSAEAVDLIGKAIAIKNTVAIYHSNLGNALTKLRRFDAAIACFEQALALNPRFPEAYSNLGQAYMNQGHRDKAVLCFEQAVALKPDFADAQFNLGNALKDLGDADRAMTCYQRVLALRPDHSAAHNNLANIYRDNGQFDAAALCYARALALSPNFAEAHSNLGAALVDQRRFDDAISCFARALALNPNFAQAHSSFGSALLEQGKLDQAIARFETALGLRPDFAEAHYNLGNALRKLGALDRAATHYRKTVELKPDFAQAHSNLGIALKTLGKIDEAVAHFEQAIALRPDFAETYIALGEVLLLRGRRDEAYAQFRRAQRLQPISRRPGIKAKADFSVLLLTAPGALNTPIEYLTGHAGYDSHFFMVMADSEYDLDLLRASADVVVNLISDADRGKDILPLAIDLVERLDRPVINSPLKIRGTGREEIAARLAGLEHCRVPKTIRISAASRPPPGALAAIPFPMLLRVSGSHGGDDFEKLADESAVAAFLARHADTDCYAIEYIPYDSADGYFRKYRLIFIDGQIFPYHLAIAGQWKVHHFRTDMANQAWMRNEEEAFVRDPSCVLRPEHWNALREIRAAIALDYFGIDFSFDRDGNIVVFEVNATTLVHDEHTDFAYKAPYIAAIKQAFDAMLGKAAQLPA